MNEASSHEKAPPGPPGKATLPPLPLPGTPPGQRQVIQAIVIAAFAGGVWLGAVRPMESKLAAKQAELKTVSASLNEFESGVAQEEPLAKVIDDLTKQARRVNAWTASSGDATRLYEAFRVIASKCSVRIERVEPSNSSRGSRSAAPSKNETTTSELFGYTIEITGTYHAVACFMDAVEQELGATKVASFHMSPAAASTAGLANSPADPLITAILETSHFKLTIPGVDPAPAKAAPPDQGTGS